jgi:hypothetical protein
MGPDYVSTSQRVALRRVGDQRLDAARLSDAKEPSVTAPFLVNVHQPPARRASVRARPAAHMPGSPPLASMQPQKAWIPGEVTELLSLTSA